jgi:hypothetical protein
MDPAGSVITAIGVPFWVKEMKRLNKLFKTLEEGINNILEWSAKLPTIIKAMVNEIAKEAGQVTIPFIMELLEKQHTQMAETIGASVKRQSRKLRATLRGMRYRPVRIWQIVSLSMGLAALVEYRLVCGENTKDLLSHLIFCGQLAIYAVHGMPGCLECPTIKVFEEVAKDKVKIQTPVRPLRFIVNLRMLPRKN